MTAGVLWSSGSGYTVSAPLPGPIPTIITIPPTTPLVSTSASLFVLLTSASPGSGFSVQTGHTLYSASFVATGTLAPVDLINTIGQDFPLANDPQGYGTYAMVLTDASIALGGQLTVTVNLGTDNLGLSDTGSIAVCVIDHQLPPGYEPWFIALVGGPPFALPVASSVSFSMAKELGPYLCLMTLSMVGASTLQVASTNDITLMPTTFLTASANGTSTSIAEYISPYLDTSPFAYPTRPDVPGVAPITGLPVPAPSMLGTWSWTTATANYSAMMFWLGPKPVSAAAFSGVFWQWGESFLPSPVGGAPLVHNVVKIVQAGPLEFGFFRSTFVLTSTGDVWAVGATNSTGLLGNGTTTNPLFPQNLITSLPPGIVDIDGGDYNMHALDSLGNLWSWGPRSDLMGLGNPVPATHYLPVISLSGVSMFAATPDGLIAQLAGTLTYLSTGGPSGTGLDTDYANYPSPAVLSSWRNANLDGLDIIHIRTSHRRAGYPSGLGFSLFVMRNGDVWMHGIDGVHRSGFRESDDTAGNFLYSPNPPPSGPYGLNPQFNGIFYSRFPLQLPWSWATNIVDVSVGEFDAVYLRANGTAFLIGSAAGPAWAGAGPAGPLPVPLDANGYALDERIAWNNTYWKADGYSPAESGAPPDIIMPPGITIASLMQTAAEASSTGAVIGSDGLIYTLGQTPPGDGTWIGNVSQPLLPYGYPFGTFAQYPFVRYGTPVSLNGLSKAKPGGMSAYNYGVWAIIDASITQPGAGGGGGFGSANLGLHGRSLGQVVG